jgi:protein involved in polysaccharide export with SLBB domain
MKYLSRFAALACLSLLAACASSPPRGPGTQIQFGDLERQSGDYEIGPGDQIALRFVMNADLNGNYPVGPDGRSIVPLISGQEIAGLTPEEASQRLTRAYSAVLRNPQVDVLITDYAAAQIYVGGQVREPGVKPIRGRLTVTSAIMQAGGFGDTARSKKVVILHQDAESHRMLMRVVDVAATLKGQDGGDFPVIPGDLIFVPRNAVGEVGQFVRDYLAILPLNLTYNINGNNGGF